MAWLEQDDEGNNSGDGAGGRAGSPEVVRGLGYLGLSRGEAEAGERLVAWKSGV